jgi:nicotinamide mononucleotide (NMN) deamidase PncC
MELMERAERVGRLLVEHGWRISVAESTAGGLISAALLKVPGGIALLRAWCCGL